MLHLVRAIVALVMDLNRENEVEKSANLVALHTFCHLVSTTPFRTSRHTKSLWITRQTKRLRETFCQIMKQFNSPREANFLALGQHYTPVAQRQAFESDQMGSLSAIDSFSCE